MDDVTFRPAAEHDTPSIASIIRGGFTSDFLGTTIYGCPGMGEYIRAHILAPSRCSDTEYFVATISDVVVGCLEFRRVPQGLWLNYVAVISRVRVRGVGTGLLDFALRTYPSSTGPELELDVLADNGPAIHWYDQLGFKTRGERRLFRFEPAESPATTDGVVAGFAQAQAAQREFGFSEFTVRTRAAEHTVGRIGATYFRLRNPAALEDAGLLPFLKRLEGGRRQILCAVSGETPAGIPTTAEHYATLVRMSVPISDLLGCLNSRHQGTVR